ncbi:MAG: hypothetical protein EVA35_00915 [Candidatus Poseidoniales archaeon]|nr:MAG: hypothetical protein EVA35_00915 [Candidatus Poseidoniales archaeon]
MVRRRIAVAILLMFILSSSQVAFAEEDGIYGKHTTGCTCHNDVIQPTPTHNFPANYIPGQTYSLSIGMSGGVSGSKGGFNLHVSDGTLSSGIGIMNTQINSGGNEATHQFPDYRSWSLDWDAPSSGSGAVAFSLAVLAANGNGQNTGDGWATTSWQSSEDSGSSNTPPVASNVTYVPTSPTKSTGLSVSYDYHDDDGDSEQGTQIKWFRNGLRVSQIDDQTDVPNSWIARGQEWQVEVTPSDVNEDGEPVMLDPVTIGNTLPVARNLDVSPTEPLDSDDLSLDYEYFDLDGNPQQNTAIQWYLDGARIVELDDSNTVSSLWTRTGDEWQALVRPHDGTDYGDTVWTGIIVIGSSNLQPSATAYISPSGNAITIDALQVIIGYNDPDGDSKDATEIRWLRDGTQVSAYNDLNWVPPEATSKGELWVAEVRVSDGLVWSEMVTTNEVLIQNSPPIVTSISMLPEDDLITTMNLTVIWEQSDIDGDAESNSEIRWWVDGEWIRDYDGMTTVPASETIRDQHWSVQVIPGDGEGLGSSMKTNARAIQNAPPGAPEIALGGDFGSSELGVPDSVHDLVVQAISEDPDEEIVLFNYQWSRNGFHVPDLDGQSVVPSSRLEPNQIWSVTVIANDPWGLTTSTSKEITIANLPPMAWWTTSPELLVPGAMMSLDGTTSTDSDGEVVTWFWTVNGVSLSGPVIDVLLPGGVHTVALTVIDDMGDSDTLENEIILGSVASVSDLSASLDGSTVRLSWNGASSEYQVYRSTSPISTVVGLTALDSIPAWGDPVPLDMEPVGDTSDTSWSETAPVATVLYYAVTTVVDGHEVVWIVAGANMVSVDATAAAESVDTDPTGSPKLLTLPIAALLLILGAAAIGITLTESRRRSV